MKIYVPCLYCEPEIRQKRKTMKRIKIGQITGAVGIRGEVRVYPYLEDHGHFSELKKIYVEERPCEICGVRYAKNMAVLRLSGVDTRNDAEALKGKNLYIDREDIWDMDENSYLTEDLIGMKVELADGTYVGTLIRVLPNPAHSLYEIETEDGKAFLLPAVGEFVREVLPEEKRMVVRLIEGLVNL